MRPRALPSVTFLCSVLFFLPGAAALESPPPPPPGEEAFIVHEGVGWCSSDLDEEMWDGTISELGDKTADDCWTYCQASFGAGEPRHEFWNDGEETWCFCQDGCLCMEDVGESSSLAPPDWVPPTGCASISSGSAPGSFDTTVSLQTAVQMWNSSQATALNTYGPISGWDVSLVTDMRGLFSEFATFDEDVTNWDTSSVTDMSRMFSVRSARA